MEKLLILSILFVHTVSADVLLAGEDVIHFDVPQGYLKKSSLRDNILLYRDEAKNPKLIVQLFWKNQWSDWHMKGLKKSRKSFQKFFDSELGGSKGEILHDVSYDDNLHILTLNWSQPDGVKLLSKMKLTSFGCVAFHVPFREGDQKEAESEILDVLASLRIPENLHFTPTSAVSDLMSNIGGGFFFLVISLVYLMFSLFKRSQLRNMKLERRMRQIKESRMQTQVN